MLIYCICFRVALSLPILCCTVHTSYRFMSQIPICRLAMCMICNSLAVAKSPLIFCLCDKWRGSPMADYTDNCVGSKGYRARCAGDSGGKTNSSCASELRSHGALAVAAKWSLGICISTLSSHVPSLSSRLISEVSEGILRIFSLGTKLTHTQTQATEI